MINRVRGVFIVMAAAVLLPLSAFAAKTAPTQTGQSIDVELHAVGETFAGHQNQTWKFNTSVAATYFTNTLTSSTPVITCTGGCSSQPATPSAPAPDPYEVVGRPQGGQAAVDVNKCEFLDGTPVTGHTYTQSVQINVSHGGGNWSFTWNYSVDPVAPGQYPPFTAWDLVDSSGDGSGLAHVTINAEIMGESAISTAKWPRKYSFSMNEPDLSNRVVGLTLSVDGVPVAYPLSTLHYPVDFTYTGNAGSNGVTSLLQNGYARTILNTDSFAGNNNGGADGSALAQAVMDATSLNLANGDHTVTLTGTVKGNSIDGTSTGANISFTVSGTVHVITPGCGGGNPN